jgi:large subunit ribosomal protein L3
MKFILGIKLGMGQIFDEKGNVIPVTLLQAGPCEVTQVKTKEKDGYEAVQFGFVKKIKKIKKTEKGKEFRYLRELRENELKIGDYGLGKKIDASVFKEGDKVLVSGISKGKGFAGVVKRWGFAGKNTTHGTKHEVRTPGSVGGRTPSRVVKGRKMAGRMGGERIMIKNLKVVKVDAKNDLIAIGGAVPGRKGALLEIKG